MKIQLCYPCVMPFQVSQRFGENHDYYYTNFKETGHNGWDFSIPIGTPLYATHSGTISFCSITNFGDLAISIIDESGEFRTIYGHLSAFKVKLGDVVNKGQLIALSGNTGRYTTGPHLHFGIHEVVKGVDINLNNGFNGGIDPAKYWDGTYPTQDDSKLKAAKFALRDWQVSVGIKDFANETL
jgi:murein DD-endopeptidase MepM/ murein hydrolase activator NlpD